MTRLFGNPHSLCLLVLWTLVPAITFTSISHANTLADIYELALKNDATLKAAEATYKANLETQKQSLSSLLPQINASGTYSETDSNSEILRPSQNENTGAFVQFPVLTDSDVDSEGYNITLTQKIFDVPAWFSFKQGKEITKQAEAQFAADQESVIIRVAEAYFNVLRAIDNLEASKAEERATKRQLEQTQQRFDVGLIAITDVHEAQASYDATVVNRLTDEGNLGTAYEALTVLTGQPSSTLWLLKADFPVNKPQPDARDEWVQFALKNNNTLKAAIYGSEASRKNSQSKRMEHLPKITGSFTYSDVEQDGSSDNTVFGQTTNLPTQSNTENEVLSFTVEMPLFAGGRISSQRRQAYQQYNAALQNKIQTQRSIIRETRAQHIIVTTDVQRVKARQQAIISSRSALEATQAGYDVGTRNIVDLLNAQRALYASLRDYANSRYDYIVNFLKLKQAAGTLSPKDIYDVNHWLSAPQAPSASTYDNTL